MTWLRAVDETITTALFGAGSRTAPTPLGRVGDVARRPPLWAGLAGALAVAGPRTRRAAARGAVAYVAAAALHLPFKMLTSRPHPAGARRLARVGPVTSSFPSGHTASEMAFAFTAAQDMPALLVPLWATSLAGSWALMRTRSHYPSDLLAGAALGAAVALAVWKLWPPRHDDGEGRAAPAGG